MQTRVVVGIDVGKDALEVAVSGSSGSRRVAIDRAGLAQLLAWIEQRDPDLVLLEASGGYEQPVLRELWAAELPTRRLNAKRVRDFARSLGLVAKTDRLDAQALVRYGEVLQPEPQAPPSPLRQQLAVWQERRRALQRMLVAEQNRAQQTADAAVRASIETVLASLRTQITEFERRMDALIAADAELATQSRLIQSVPGLAAHSARSLLSGVPELGQGSAKEIAALCGLAPFNCDSGHFRGERHISGGRRAVRTDLYMPTVAAISCNPVLRGFYARLLEAGKPTMVALTAVMRKLVVLVNAMLRDGCTWEELEINRI